MNAVDPIPAGYTSLTPFLCVPDAAAAIDYYTEVFGATVVERMNGPERADGTTIVMHAELDFGNGRLQLSDPQSDYDLVAPSAEPGRSNTTVVYCPNVDEVVERAIAGGATVREPVSTFVTGDRFASIIDPFGQRWAVMTRVENVDPDEVARRLAEFAAESG